MGFLQPDDLEFALEEVLAYGHIDEEVGRAVTKGLGDLSYQAPVKSELMKCFLAATIALPLETITTHDDALARSSASLATTDAAWLLDHIQSRSMQGGSKAYQDADILAGLFDHMEVSITFTAERASMHQQVFERLWVWQQQTGWSLTKRSAPGIFKRFIHRDAAGATQFLRQVISNAPDTDILIQILEWVFTLPSPVQTGELMDEVVVQAIHLQATLQDMEELQAGVIRYAHSQLRTKIGRGPFPDDVALRELAEMRLQSAQERVLLADPAAVTLKSFWKSVLEHANSQIQRTLDREIEMYGPEDE